jgi:hypothetical protein
VHWAYPGLLGRDKITRQYSLLRDEPSDGPVKFTLERNWLLKPNAPLAGLKPSLRRGRLFELSVFCIAISVPSLVHLITPQRQAWRINWVSIIRLSENHAAGWALPAPIPSYAVYVLFKWCSPGIARWIIHRPTHRLGASV